MSLDIIYSSNLLIIDLNTSQHSSPTDHIDTVLPELVVLPRQPSSRAHSREAHTPRDQEKLVFKEGNIYKCILGPEDLPGLKAWTLQSIKDRSKWSINMNEYTPASNFQVISSLAKERLGMKRTVPYLYLHLVSLSDTLLKGMDRVINAEDFRSKWKRNYEFALSSDLSKYPQEVTVCGNCDAIIAKLKQLVQVDFAGESLVPSPRLTTK